MEGWLNNPQLLPNTVDFSAVAPLTNRYLQLIALIFVKIFVKKEKKSKNAGKKTNNIKQHD